MLHTASAPLTTTWMWLSLSAAPSVVGTVTGSTLTSAMAAITDELASYSCPTTATIGERRAVLEDLSDLPVDTAVPDEFVFGCGMDVAGSWRNLPEIRAMKGA